MSSSRFTISLAGSLELSKRELDWVILQTVACLRKKKDVKITLEAPSGGITHQKYVLTLKHKKKLENISEDVSEKE